MIRILKDNVEIEYSIEYRKGTKWNERKGATYKYMECKICGQMTKCGEEATAITCSDCVNELMNNQFGGPENQTKGPTGFHRGWRWMKEFVHKDGRVFHRGIEQTKLKGKLPPTEIKERLRLKSKQKEDIKRKASVQVHKLKKQLEKARWKKDKKVIMREIKFYNRIINGKISQEIIQKYLEGNFLVS